MAETEPGRVLELYRELVSPKVTKASLFDRAGNYKPENVWNTERGIVHYVMSINGISPLVQAEQDSPIVAGALDNYDAMPLAFAGGTPLFTSADARFSLDIGVLQRLGHSVTVREPLGLYMTGWDDTGFTKPDGTPVDDYWRVVRGDCWRRAAARVRGAALGRLRRRRHPHRRAARSATAANSRSTSR